MRTLTLIAPFILLACSNGAGQGNDAAGTDATGSDTMQNPGDSGGATDAGGASDAGTADAGSVDADWGFTGGIVGSCDGGAALATCPVVYLFIVNDAVRAGIDDAVVTVNGETLPPGMSGLYQAHTTMPFAANYDVSVTHAGLTLRAAMPSPDDFALTVAPDPPAANTAATLTWTPSGRSDVEVLGQVFLPDGTPMFNTVQMDTGTMTLPADSFPQSGHYQLVVQRRVNAPDQSHRLPTGGSPRNVGLVRTIDVMVQ